MADALGPRRPVTKVASVNNEPTAPGDPALPSDANEVEELHHLVHELEMENEALRASQERSEGKGRRTTKAVISWIMIVVACLLAVLSVVTVYVRNQLLNTDTFVATVAPLAKDPAVQSVVATRVSTAVVAHANLDQRIKDALPPRAAFLAGPLTSGVQNLAYQVTLKLVQSNQFQTLWVQAVRSSHQQVDTLLLGQKEGAFNTANGQVTVNLGQVEETVKGLLRERGLSFIDKVPNYDGAPVVLFQSAELLKLQRLVRLLNHLAVVLPIVTLLLLAGAVALVEDRRKGIVRASGGLALSMAVVLIGANVARNQYLGGLLPSAAKNAQTAVIDTVSALLLDSVRTILIAALVIMVLAMAAGNRHVRDWLANRQRPAWMTSGPVHDVVSAHRRIFQWAVVALGLAILVLWNKPTTLVAIVVILITLVAVGLVGVFAGKRGAPDPTGAPTDQESMASAP